MIRAAHVLSVAARFIHHGHGVMPADVVERAQFAVAAAHRDNRLSRDGCSHILPRLFDLRGAPNRLPRARKHILQLELRDARVGVPWRWNRVRILQSGSGIVGSENFLHRRFHAILS